MLPVQPLLEFEQQVELLLEFVQPLVLQQMFEPLPELVLEELYSQKLLQLLVVLFVLHGKLLQLLPLPPPLFQLPLFVATKHSFRFQQMIFQLPNSIVPLSTQLL